MRSAVIRNWAVLCLVLLGVANATTAHADAPPAAAPPRQAPPESAREAAPGNATEAVRLLESGEPDSIREGVDMLVALDDPGAVPRFAKLLRAGQTDAVTDRILAALGGLARPTAIDVIEPFTRHRRTGARLAAYRALAGIKSPRVAPMVARGLSDSDRTVRAASAVALGEMGAKETVPTLFRAFDRGVVEAAESIGSLGDAAAVTKFHESLGTQRLSVMLGGYKRFLARTDIAVAVKQDILTRLGEVAGPEIKQFMLALVAAPPKAWNPKLARIARDTANRIPDRKPANTRPGAR
ncbi:MAG: HEAT repeat domain-containing protein [Polyangiales bacterium]